MKATNKAKAGFGLAVGAAIMLSWPAPLPAVTVPPQIYVLINNTRVSVTCQVATVKPRWSRPFLIAASRQWASGPYDRYAQLYFQCGPPVRQTAYVLNRGKRYSLQRVRGSAAVDIVEVI